MAGRTRPGSIESMPEPLVSAIGADQEPTMLAGDVARRVKDSRPVPPPGMDAISARELEVLGLMAEGLTNRQIAARLWISGSTVKTHVSHILRKLGQPDRTRASLLAMSKGIVAAPE